MKNLKLRMKSFTSGFIVATFLSSLFVYAGTLIEGIYQFADGEVISAAEMNHNFQRIRGNVLLEATNTTAVSLQINTAAQECEGGFPSQCSAGFVEFGNETAGAIETRTDPSLASPQASATAQGPMSFITIPNDGFYQITVTGSPTGVTVSPHNETGEVTTLEVNFAMIKFDATDPTAGAISPGMSAMPPRVDGVDIYSDIESRSVVRRGDSDFDGTEDVFTQDIEGGVKKEIYLKANDGVALY